MRLNPEQREAVRHDGHLALASCPGSGKTRTIVAKLLYCIDDVRDSTRRVAAITYTNAAVDEMQARLFTYGSTDDHGYYEVATIHSFCVGAILRPFHHLLPTFEGGFAIVGPEDEMWQELVSEIVATHDLPRRTDIAEAFERVHRRLDGTIFLPDGISEVAARNFLEHLDRDGRVSFPEIMFHAATIVQRFPFVARALASRYAWLLVDEFQDTSDEQVEILKAIAVHGRTAFFIVGDRNQAIMSFAGASPTLMDTFADAIGARRDVHLRGNYRCSSRIIAHAERMCASVEPMQALGEWHAYDFEPRHHHVPSREAAILDWFLPEVRARSICLGKAAVLARSWFPLFHLARTLRKQHIPVIGPGARPYRRVHAFATLAENLAAHMGGGDTKSFARLQRALLFAVRDLTGELDWRVYSYPGRVLLCALLNRVRVAAADCASWITAAAAAAAELLMDAEMLSSTHAVSLRSSAAAMLADMAVRGVDPGLTTIDDIGMFARPESALHLITMHRAKGREFDAVAIIDLHDGRVPDHRSVSDAERLGEERRLLYVAVTRSRKVLMYFTDSSHWKNHPSRFLGEDALDLL